jgi:hypothetical protein
LPRHADKELYGIRATVEASEEFREAARQAGLYVATFDDELMRFHIEDGFVAKAY